MNRNLELLLPLPVVPQAPDGIMDPAYLSGDVTIEVAFPDMRPTDWIGVVWNGNDTYPQQAGNASGSVAFIVPLNDVEMALGNTFPVTYRVLRDGVTTGSEPFYVRVAVPSMPTAYYPDAPYEALDIRVFEGDLIVKIAPWPLIFEGQHVFVEAKANLDGGAYYDKTIREGLVTAEEIVAGLSLTVPRADIEAMGNGATFAVQGTLTYRNGAIVHASRNRLLDTLVSGEGVTLVPPSIDEAMEGVLPLDVTSIHVRVPASARLRTNDTVTLCMYGGSTSFQPVNKTVTTEAGREMVFDSPWSGEIATLRGETVTFYYEIDRASGDHQPWSGRYQLRLEGGRTLIPTVDHQVDGFLDPVNVPDGTNFRTPALWSVQNGDIVRVQWSGSSAATSLAAVFDATRGKAIVYPIPLRYITENDAVEIAAYYLLESAGAIPFMSPLLRFSVGPGPLPPPRVVEAPGGVLAPLMVLEGATVRISYPDMRETDTIALSFDGNEGFPVQNGSATGSILFSIPAEDVGRAIGRTVTVHYTRLRDAVPSVSRTLTLVVEAIPVDAMPVIHIPVAIDDIVDLRTFDGDAMVEISPWPLIAAGQTIWLKLTGIPVAGSPVVKELLSNLALSADDVAKGVKALIPRSDLERLVGGYFGLQAQVAFDGGDAEATGILLPYTESRVIGDVRRSR